LIESGLLDGSFVRKHLTGQETLRPTVIFWPNEVAAIADAYLQHRGLVHGVQKDAIQNSWDAREDKKGRNWSMTFELIESKAHGFFVFSDRGTKGLTGKVLKPEEMDQDLPEDQRWGRFESLAFKKTPEQEKAPLGSRGRGKFIFVAASRRYTILYDTLRKDGVYRLGVRWVVPTQSLLCSWENDEARQKLFDMTEGALKPLDEVGTRVIIVDPKDELVEALRNGTVARFIGETWWEIIEKYAANIVLKFDQKEVRAVKPNDLELPENDTKDYAVWSKKNEKQKRGNVSFFVKRLQIVSAKKRSISEDLRGVAIQRGGMKICSISHRYLPQNISETILGYVTLDEDAERELRQLEDPEHYSFDFSKGTARALRDYIQEELDEFAKRKLGWGADIRQIKRANQQEAERQAIWAANRIAKKLGVLGKIREKTRRKGAKGREWKEIRLRLDCEFPKEDTIRINWGQKLREIVLEAVNDSSKPLYFKLKIFIRLYDKVVKTLLEKDITVQPSTTLQVFGPQTEQIEKKSYPEKGKYFVVGRMVSLMPEDKGSELDEIKQAFFVEKDPPLKGLFEKCEPIGTDPTWIGTVEKGDEGGWTLVYNIDHPSYLANDEPVEKQTDYLFRLAAHGICIIDLEAKKSKLIEKPEDLERHEFADSLLQAIGRIMYEYHS